MSRHGRSTTAPPAARAESADGPRGEMARSGAIPSPPRPRMMPGIILPALFAVAALLRVWTVAALARDWRVSDPVLDGLHYMQVAKDLARGASWPSGPIFMTPLYPFLLSLLFRIAPPEVLTVQIFQSVLGLGTLLLLLRAAKRDLGEPAAWLLGALYVLYGPVPAMESQTLTEVLLLFLAAAALALWPATRSARWKYLLFGVVCGCLTIGRGAFLLLPAGAVAWLLYLERRETRSARLGAAALIAAGVLLALAPVAIYQTRATGRLELLTMNGGLNLYIGNNPSARGIYSAPPDIDLEDDPTATRSASIAAGRDLTLRESSRYWTGRALSFMTGHPGRLLWLLGRKALLFFSPREIPQLENFDRQRREFPPLRLAFVDFAWLLPLSLLGIAAARRAPSLLKLRPSLAPWLIVAATGWISTILFFATGRYRIPFLAAFFGLAAVGLRALLEMIRRRSLHPIAAVLPAAIALQWLLPSYPRAPAEAHDDTQHAAYLARLGQPAAALEAYREAMRVWPQDGEAWHGAAVALVKLGRLPEAAEAFRTASRWLPRSAVTHYDLGSVYGRLGEDAKALAEFEEAVRLDPLDPRFQSDLAVALARNGRTDEALATLREVVRRNPEYVPARRKLDALEARTNPDAPEAR